MSLELLWNSSAAGEDSLITTQLPGQFSDQVKEVSARLMQLLDSETMEQHQMAVANFSKVGTVHLVISSNVTHITQDIVVTTRWSTVVGRDAVRVGFYRFKYFASVEAQPILAEVNTSDPAALTILYLMQITLLPKRTWINPIGFLLPYRLPCTAIIKVTLGSRKRMSDITAVESKVVNRSEAPDWLRALTGYAWATSALLLEPLWSKCVHLLGDDSYVKSKRS